MAFLAGLGSAACGFLFVREVLWILSRQATPGESRLGLAIALLGFSVSLGVVAILLLRRR
ncbi:hypothetical protein ACRAWG_36745 [Methylobacterium sp. P31]